MPCITTACDCKTCPPWLAHPLPSVNQRLDPASLRGLPDARVRGVGAQLPALPIEGNPLDGIKIDAVKTTGVDHVIGGIRSRTIERSNAAVAAEVVQRALGAELIRREISLPLDKAEPIRGDHVVEVALAPANRAIAFTHAAKLGSNFKTDASAVTRALISLQSDRCIHLGSPRRLASQFWRAEQGAKRRARTSY